jgi:hypothetical protein
MQGINNVKVINGKWLITSFWRRLFGCKREEVSGEKQFQ